MFEPTINFSKTTREAIRAANMSRRVKGLRSHIARVPLDEPCSPKNAAAFQARIQEYTPQQMRVVGSLLAQAGHIPLFDNLHDAGLLEWDRATTFYHLVKLSLTASYIPDLKVPYYQNLWAFGERHSVQEIWFCSAMGTINLPLEGWLWLGQRVVTDPLATMTLLSPSPHLSSVIFATNPPLDNEKEKTLYAQALQKIYIALHDATFPPNKTPQKREVYSNLLHNIYAMETALLCGWPWHHVEPFRRFQIDDLRREINDAFVEKIHPFWAVPRSAHEQLAFQAELDSLTLEQRQDLLVHLQKLQDFGVFAYEPKHNKAMQHPLYVRLFHSRP